MQTFTTLLTYPTTSPLFLYWWPCCLHHAEYQDALGEHLTMYPLTILFAYTQQNKHSRGVLGHSKNLNTVFYFQLIINPRSGNFISSTGEDFIDIKHPYPFLPCFTPKPLPYGANITDESPLYVMKVIPYLFHWEANWNSICKHTKKYTSGISP